MRRNPIHTPAAIAGLAMALAAAATASAGPQQINLADIVGGGNGTGTGGDQGINIADGTAPTDHTTGHKPPVNSYTDVSSNDLIDGVFFPDGKDGDGNNIAVQVNSDGTTVTGLAHGAAKTFDYLWNGMNANPDKNHNFASETNLDDGVPVIGAHATKAVTFDLNAIESAHREVTGFTGDAAMSKSGNNGVAFYAIVDGTIAASQSFNGEQAKPLDTSIPADAKFLTLAALDMGDFKSDHSFFRDPQLTLIPEPATLALLAPAGLLMLRRRR